MTFTEYQEKALRTIKPHATKNEAICDWAMGFIGEVTEVVEVLLPTTPSYKVNKMELAKEVGDVCWYTAALVHELNITSSVPGSIFVDVSEALPGEDMDVAQMVCIAGRVIEKVKHLTMHKEDIDFVSLWEHIEEVLWILGGICVSFNFTILDALELNTAKLDHRYNLAQGGAYDNTASANRKSKETEFKSTEIYKRLEAQING